MLVWMAAGFVCVWSCASSQGESQRIENFLEEALGRKVFVKAVRGEGGLYTLLL